MSYILITKADIDIDQLVIAEKWSKIEVKS